jgi:hypothetical protein
MKGKVICDHRHISDGSWLAGADSFLWTARASPKWTIHQPIAMRTARLPLGEEKAALFFAQNKPQSTGGHINELYL